MSYAGWSERDESVDEQFDVCAVIERHDVDVECTLYPSDATGVDLMSRWITAGEGSFVSLAEMH